MQTVTTKQAERYEILRGYDLEFGEIESLISLDNISLDACYHVSAADDYALFRLNRENGLVVCDRETGELIGYSMLVPVKPETYSIIRQGAFIDTALRPEMLVKYDHPGIYDLYFASVIIHPKHRGLRLVVKMLDAMVQDFIDLAGRGIFIRKMLADVVSTDGEKFCRLFGLEEVCDSNHKSKIYEVSGLPPKIRITTDATQRLFDIYSAKFQTLANC